MKKALIPIFIIILLSGCMTYEKIENGKKSGFSTNPMWWIEKAKFNKLKTSQSLNEFEDDLSEQ